MNGEIFAARTVRGSSGEELLLMAIAADRRTKQAIDAELDQRSKPHLHGRLARRSTLDLSNIATPAA